MRAGRIGAGRLGALGLLLCLAGTGPLAAQQHSPAMQPDPNLNTEDQLAPSQMKQQMPSAVAEPTGDAHGAAHGAAYGAAHPPAHAAVAARRAAAPKMPLPSAHVVACSGIFAKNSNHLRLAMTFDYKNVSFGDVAANGGAKVEASIVFPNDPKRRLEVWWSNPAERSGVYLIDIKGKSEWSGPDGLRLGLNVGQLEKLNRKPFKLKGFDKNGVATVSDWDGGELAALPGGCKSGVSLAADPKVSADSVAALSADKDYSSDDPAVRASKPTVSEILIGY
ncbi:MAG: hypothetical protein WB868_03905 [Xanthobacteraceae bacterium]